MGRARVGVCAGNNDATSNHTLQSSLISALAYGYIYRNSVLFFILTYVIHNSISIILINCDVKRVYLCDTLVI